MKSVYYNENNFEIFLSSFNLDILRNRGALGKTELTDSFGKGIGKFFEIKYFQDKNLLSKLFSNKIIIKPREGLEKENFIEVYLNEKILEDLKNKRFYHFSKQNSLITFNLNKNTY